jgi:hypothetical protein
MAAKDFFCDHSVEGKQALLECIQLAHPRGTREEILCQAGQAILCPFDPNLYLLTRSDDLLS